MQVLDLDLVGTERGNDHAVRFFSQQPSHKLERNSVDPLQVVNTENERLERAQRRNHGKQHVRGTGSLFFLVDLVYRLYLLEKLPHLRHDPAYHAGNLSEPLLGRDGNNATDSRPPALICEMKSSTRCLTVE